MDSAEQARVNGILLILKNAFDHSWICSHQYLKSHHFQPFSGTKYFRPHHFCQPIDIRVIFKLRMCLRDFLSAFFWRAPRSRRVWSHWWELVLEKLLKVARGWGAQKWGTVLSVGRWQFARRNVLHWNCRFIKSPVFAGLLVHLVFQNSWSSGVASWEDIALFCVVLHVSSFCAATKPATLKTSSGQLFGLQQFAVQHTLVSWHSAVAWAAQKSQSCSPWWEKKQQNTFRPGAPGRGGENHKRYPAEWWSPLANSVVKSCVFIGTSDFQSMNCTSLLPYIRSPVLSGSSFVCLINTFQRHDVVDDLCCLDVPRARLRLLMPLELVILNKWLGMTGCEDVLSWIFSDRESIFLNSVDFFLNLPEPRKSRWSAMPLLRRGVMRNPRNYQTG